MMREVTAYRATEPDSQQQLHSHEIQSGERSHDSRDDTAASSVPASLEQPPTGCSRSELNTCVKRGLVVPLYSPQFTLLPCI